jgi:hypothetical protein
VLLVAGDHRSARRRRVAIDELADEEWIVRSDHPVVEVLRRSGQGKDRADTPVEAAFHKLLAEIGTAYDPD